jgi:hypothetical protein
MNQITLQLAGNRAVLVMLVVACILETAQKFVPYVHLVFNAINVVIKPISGYLLVIIFSILCTHSKPDLVAQVLGVGAGIANLGLHVTKNVYKAGSAIPVPALTPVWGLVENVGALVAIILGTLVLAFT